MRPERAMQMTKFGAPEALALSQIQLPALGPKQVRVALGAAGVNFADGLIIAAKYQMKPVLPFTPGLEGAGKIVEVGSQVTNLSPGQRVAVFTRPGGCYATSLVIDSDRVAWLPDGVDLVTAACLPVAYGTAYLALVRRADLKAGETLLVTGAAGGVGLAAVAIGKALGARVIAAARGTDRLRVAVEHGADEVVDYGSEDLRDRVKAVTNGKGAHVIFDPVGGDIFDQCLRAMGWHGRMLVVGFASGRIPAAPANLVLLKNFSLIGVDWGAETDRDPASTCRDLSELFSWAAQGRLKPHVSAIFELEQAGAALRRVMDRRATGKVALRM